MTSQHGVLVTYCHKCFMMECSSVASTRQIQRRNFRRDSKSVFFSGVDVILGMPVSLRVFNLRAQTKRISLFAATTDKVALTIQAQRCQVRKVRPSSYFSGVDVIFSTEMPLSQRVFVLFAKPNGSWRMVETTNKVDLRQKSTVYGVRFRKYGQVGFFLCG